jgi:protein-disulfide isomerase
LKTSLSLFISLVLTVPASAQNPAATRSPKAPPTASKVNASSTTPSAKTPSPEMVEGFMRHMFSYDPNLKWKVESITPSEVPGVTEVVVIFGDPPQQQRTPFYVASDLQHAFIGQIIPFGADPFAPVRTKLLEGAKGPVQGNASAPVQIVEFSDFQCPHCKRAQPKIEQLMSQAPNARLVFENFPLTQIHKWAERAADYADCLARKSPEQFWKFARAVYDQQEQITDQNAVAKLGAIATDAGADAFATATCADSSETKARVTQQYALGSAVGVNATPTIFINGRKIENVNETPIEVLKQMIDFEAQEASKK